MILVLVLLVAAGGLSGAWFAFRRGSLRGLAQWYFDEEAPMPARAAPFLLLLAALVAVAGLAMALSTLFEPAWLRVVLNALVLMLILATFAVAIALVTYLPPWLKPQWLLDEEQRRWRVGPGPTLGRGTAERGATPAPWAAAGSAAVGAVANEPVVAQPPGEDITKGSADPITPVPTIDPVAGPGTAAVPPPRTDYVAPGSAVTKEDVDDEAEPDRGEAEPDRGEADAEPGAKEARPGPDKGQTQANPEPDPGATEAEPDPSEMRSEPKRDAAPQSERGTLEPEPDHSPAKPPRPGVPPPRTDWTAPGS